MRRLEVGDLRVVEHGRDGLAALGVMEFQPMLRVQAEYNVKGQTKTNVPARGEGCSLSDVLAFVACLLSDVLAFLDAYNFCRDRSRKVPAF